MSSEGSPVVLVLADDLIWAERLARALTEAGATVRRVRDVAGLEGAGAGAGAGLGSAGAAVIDLTARAYDGVAAVAAAHSAGLRVLAIGQHDDLALRKAALAAGAEWVYAYRKLFEDGPATLRAWLAAGASVARPD